MIYLILFCTGRGIIRSPFSQTISLPSLVLAANPQEACPIVTLPYSKKIRTGQNQSMKFFLLELSYADQIS